MLYNGSMMK